MFHWARVEQDTWKWVFYQMLVGAAHWLVLNRFIFCSYHHNISASSRDTLDSVTNICCILFVLSPFHRGRSVWNIKLCLPNFILRIALTCLGFVSISLQWLLCVLHRGRGKKDTVYFKKRSWSSFKTVSYFFGVNSILASRKGLTQRWVLFLPRAWKSPLLWGTFLRTSHHSKYCP